MTITAELHIDSKGFTWEFYDKDHVRIADWTMKKDPKGGFRGIVKGGVSDALTNSGRSDELFLDPLIELFEEESDFPSPDDVVMALHQMEDE